MKVSPRSFLNFCRLPKNIVYNILPAVLVFISLGYGGNTYLLNRYDRQLQEVLHPPQKAAETVSCSFARSEFSPKNKKE